MAVWIDGFIVNIHDPTNCDIDFGDETNQLLRKRGLIANPYTYLDLNTGENKESVSFRCRINGVGKKKKTKASGKITSLINSLINRSDGWVKCRIVSIDTYSRILTDIFIMLPDGNINLAEYLMENDKNTYFPYVRRF